jgi:hypothetical protein
MRALSVYLDVHVGYEGGRGDSAPGRLLEGRLQDLDPGAQHHGIRPLHPCSSVQPYSESESNEYRNMSFAGCEIFCGTSAYLCLFSKTFLEEGKFYFVRNLFSEVANSL